MDLRIASLLTGMLILSTFLAAFPVQGTSAGVKWVDDIDHATT
jgi:hypothetical protein